MTKLTGTNKRVANISCFLILGLFSVVFYAFITFMNFVPTGTDVWGHVYKASFMYDNLKKGIFYPLYDMNWYNGIETFRYWGPVSYYLYCIPLVLTGGAVELSYRLFVTMVIFLAGVPWVILGIRTNRRTLGTVMGIMWYMFPENLNVMFAQGNVPQIVTIMLTPYVFMFMWIFLKERKNLAGLALTITMALMTVTHLMLAGITGLSMFIFLVIDALINKDYRRKFFCLVFMACGILIMFIWVLPALFGGMINSNDSGQSAASIFVTDLRISLNPVNRFLNSFADFYFGLSFVIMAVFGIIASKKKNHSGFIYLLVVMVMNSVSANEFITKLPFSGLFWMERFTPFAYGAFLVSLLEWNTIKKKFMAMVMAILIIDSIPFYAAVGLDRSDDRYVWKDADKLVAHSPNRVAILDMSSYGPYPSYALPEAGIKYSYGWAWQGAATMDNIMLINEATETERYEYAFDRCLELCDDTVLVRNWFVPSYAENHLVGAAESRGYELVECFGDAYLFKLKEIPATGSFGTITTYRGIAIGKYAQEMTTMYAAFCYGESNYIDDYSLDELKSYESIFLSGFSYHNKEAAEKLIEDLGESGVRVVIDAGHLPSDSKTKEEVFFGVTASTIEFTNHFPVLRYNGMAYTTDDFNREYRSFNTRYIAKIDNPTGTFNLGANELVFCGTTNRSENVVFVGLNIMFQAIEVNDEALLGMYDSILGISHTDLPDRNIVPISYEFDGKSIAIKTDYDNVSTGIAWAECFNSPRNNNLKSELNLLVVDKGTTVVEFEYPMYKKGLALSCFGLLFTVGAYIVFFRLEKKSRQE